MRVNSSGGRALIVTPVFTRADASARIGDDAYSYYYVYQAFAPLLERWGRVTEITRTESRLDYAIWQARQAGLEPAHLSFLPFQHTYLSANAPNIGYPFWEFPDIPNEGFDSSPRNNWVRGASHLDLILTASTFTRDAFLRAGVKAPIRVVPVPLSRAYLAAPRWEPGQTILLDQPCHILPQKTPNAPSIDAWAERPRTGLWLRARRVLERTVKPRLPRLITKTIAFARRHIRPVQGIDTPYKAIAKYPASPGAELSGVVYTTILNPLDERKNWTDLISAFLLALREEDATLVVKLVLLRSARAFGLDKVLGYYQKLGLRHRCRLVIVPGYLSDAQMVELARASTYYVNASRAEGACLPLQDFLAAGRPAIAPCHTALTDYFHDEVGFVVASHPESTSWPHDPRGACRTSWHRVVWQSLHDQFRASFEVAKRDLSAYRALSDRGREAIASFAAPERVWPHLQAALDLVNCRQRSAGELAVLQASKAS